MKNLQKLKDRLIEIADGINRGVDEGVDRLITGSLRRIRPITKYPTAEPFRDSHVRSQYSHGDSDYYDFMLYASLCK
ncbi:MAG: hypothetical protein WC796_05960 [Candidatus Pacearchaeota archaeon]|jgi:hypothetical protein